MGRALSSQCVHAIWGGPEALRWIPIGAMGDAGDHVDADATLSTAPLTEQ